MSYPPGNFPSGPEGYQQGPPPGRDPSPWSSPIVLVAIAAGVLIVVGGVLAALLLLPRSGDDAANEAGQTTTQNVPTTTDDTSSDGNAGNNSGGSSTSGDQAPSTTPVDSPTTNTTPQRPVPTVSGADWQGFNAGPRCNAADDPAIAIGRTARSQVVICQVGDQTGRWYYKGLADGNPMTVDYPTRVGNAFHATRGDTTYIVSAGSLQITQSGSTLANEPMLEYWEN